MMRNILSIDIKFVGKFLTKVYIITSILNLNRFFSICAEFEVKKKKSASNFYKENNFKPCWGASPASKGIGENEELPITL